MFRVLGSLGVKHTYWTELNFFEKGALLLVPQGPRREITITVIYFILFLEKYLGKPQNVSFSGPATKALPPPFELSGHIFFSDFFSSSIKIFSFLLVVRPLTPPLLVAGPLKQTTLFAASFTELIF